jgi:hypothetical protein
MYPISSLSSPYPPTSLFPPPSSSSPLPSSSLPSLLPPQSSFIHPVTNIEPVSLTKEEWEKRRELERRNVEELVEEIRRRRDKIRKMEEEKVRDETEHIKILIKLKKEIEEEKRKRWVDD